MQTRASGITSHLSYQTQRNACDRFLEAVEEFGAATTTYRFHADEAVFRGGEPSDGLYVLSDGALRIREYRAGGKEVTMRLLAPNDTFGRLHPDSEAAETGDGLTSSGTFGEAITDSEVKKVPKVFVQRAVRSHPQNALDLLGIVELRLADQEEFTRCIQAWKTEARLARLLPLLASKFGSTDNRAAMGVWLRLTHQDLAEMVCATRESVTKAMAELVRRRAIQLDNGHIVLADISELSDIAWT